jgi:hypothetical protein
MAVELNGNVRMHGDTGPGVGVKVLAEERRLRLTSGAETVGDWMVPDIGIVALQDGFNIRADGEEFILHTEDDVALAEEIGVAAASPRLARRIAARHNPEARQQAPTVTEAEPVPSNLAAIGFAVAGALVVLGGTFLNSGTFDYWVAFVVGGAIMIASAYMMSLGLGVGRIIAWLVLGALIIVFGLAVAVDDSDAGQLSAYGFVAGGLVVGIAVMFSGSGRQS